MSVGLRMLLVSIVGLMAVAVVTDHWAWVVVVYIYSALFCLLRWRETRTEERQ